jgi:subtilisin family serine protease
MIKNIFQISLVALFLLSATTIPNNSMSIKVFSQVEYEQLQNIEKSFNQKKHVKLILYFNNYQSAHKIINKFKNRINFKTIEIGTPFAYQFELNNYLTWKDLLAFSSEFGIIEDTIFKADLSKVNTFIGTPKFWNSTPIQTSKGQNQLIAILDTGVSSNHSFLKNKVKYQACFSTGNSTYKSTSLCPNQQDQSFDVGSGEPCSFSSICNHGSHVAGIATGDKTFLGSNVTFNGIAPLSDLISIQVFSKFDNASVCNPLPVPCALSYLSDNLKALNYLNSLSEDLKSTNSNYRIASINMSLGSENVYTSSCNSGSLYNTINNLKNKNIATVIAAGNTGKKGVSFPGCISPSITVGAVDYTSKLSTYSNYDNDLVDVYAPGNNILSSNAKGTYQFMTGTSMSTPVISGAIALLSSRYPNNTLDENMKLIKETGKTVTSPSNQNLDNARALNVCASYIKEDGVWKCNN